MASITKYGICSQALVKLGAEPISSFTMGTWESQIAGTLYDGIKRAELSLYNWNFATKTGELAFIDEEPADKRFSYAFRLPSNALEVRKVTDDAGCAIPYLLEDNKVLTNSRITYAKYRYDADEASMPDWFVNLLVAKLAWEFAEPLGAEGTTEQRRQEEYAAKLKLARIADSQANPPQAPLISPENSQVNRARRGGHW